MRRAISPAVLAIIVFLALAPVTVDTYNSLNQRAFMDAVFRGNPFSLAANQTVSFRGETWPLDWPYPPLTIVLILPAWLVYNGTHSEALYQIIFKLPFLLSILLTQHLLETMIKPELTSERHRLANWYSLLPVVVMFTSVAGGFDIVAALLILAGYSWFVRDRLALSALSIGVAGALRIYPLVLAPVYLVHLWKMRPLNRRAVLNYFGLLVSPLLVSCFPFIVADWAGFIATPGNGQLAFGPFSTANFVTIVAFPLIWLGGQVPDFQGLGYVFLAVTAAALACFYIYSLSHQPDARTLLRNNLLALLVFFCSIPKCTSSIRWRFCPLH